MLSIIARKSILVCLVVLLFLACVDAVQQPPRHHHRGHKHKHHRHKHAHKHHHVKSCSNSTGSARNSTVSAHIKLNATTHSAHKPMPLAAHNHGPVNLTAAHNHGPVNLTAAATKCNKTKSADHSSAGKKGIPKTLIPKHKHSKTKPKAAKTNSTSSGSSSSSSSGSMSVSAGFSGAKALWAPPPKSLSFSDFDVTQEAYRMDVTKIVQAPNGISAIKAIYPQGSIDPGNKGNQGGFGFYASPKQISWKSAKTVSLSYGVYFQPGFGWQMGGKLPGLIGGHTGCSGGVDAKSAGCFSTRFMWRENGAGEVYLYIPANDQDPSFWKVGPKTINTGMGISFARGSFSFKAGAWTQIQQVVTLNDPGQKNGKLVVSVNGKQVLSFDKMNYRDAAIPLIGIDGESFFGGSSQEYASPKNQYAYFGNWHVASN